VMSVTLSSSMFFPFGSISASQHISKSPGTGDLSAFQLCWERLALVVLSCGR
jgi:hypothetical protein